MLQPAAAPLRAGSRPPSDRGTGLRGPAPVGAWLPVNQGAGPCTEAIRVWIRRPQPSFIVSSGIAEHRACQTRAACSLLNSVSVLPGMGAPARLLVVDDEPRTAQVTAELLRRAGYAVDVALSGTEALSRVRSEIPDL